MKARNMSEQALARANFLIAVVGLGGLLAIAFGASPFQIKGASSITPIAGFTIFSVLYLAAQLSERLTELVSDFSAVAGKSATNADRTNEDIDVTKTRINELLKVHAEHPPALVIELVAQVKQLEMKSHYEDNRRALGLWVVASAVGVSLTSLTVGFFNLIGLTWMPHNWDSFISGVIIGGGSKPLHDFIGYLKTQKG
jgi:hypothetical protein